MWQTGSESESDRMPWTRFDASFLDSFLSLTSGGVMLSKAVDTIGHDKTRGSRLDRTGQDKARGSRQDKIGQEEADKTGQHNMEQTRQEGADKTRLKKCQQVIGDHGSP